MPIEPPTPNSSPRDVHLVGLHAADDYLQDVATFQIHSARPNSLCMPLKGCTRIWQTDDAQNIVML